MAQLTEHNAQKKLSDMGMPDLPLMLVKPVATKLSPDWFNKYKTLCKQFMSSLSDNVDTLAMMNLSQEEFMNILMGRAIPQNISFRFRIPLQWGGKLDTDNIFMCKTFPHSFNMDMFIISQSGNEQIWLPNPKKKIYLPAHTATGGTGGNATEDRITETIASQIVSDRDF
ncbi:MAG: hypothetical protein UIH99_03675 [Alphaproteobacteria bacterium]|nr:hypothetical protein [Alphaproteobacteria bacterium]